MAGLRVLGTAGSDAGIELLKQIGIKEMFNHKSENCTQDIMVKSSYVYITALYLYIEW